jgi:hypothetical protein
MQHMIISFVAQHRVRLPLLVAAALGGFMLTEGWQHWFPSVNPALVLALLVAMLIGTGKLASP